VLAELRGERLDDRRFLLRHAPVPTIDPPPQAETQEPWPGAMYAFRRGMFAATQTILTYTLFATYLGVGALAHDLNFR
jgi:hypothetical protein